MSEKADSREKILSSACKLFAEKGFKQTTVRDICRDSGSYQISINYYFGSKENLFKEVILKSFEYTGFIKLPELVKGFEPEEQLYKILKARINLTFEKGEKTWFFNILSKEFNVHSELIRPLIPQTIMCFFDLVKSVLRKINPNASELDIEYCCFLVIAQSITLAFNDVAKQRLFSSDTPTEEEIDRLAQKMSFYIIQGLKKSDMENENE